MAFLKGNTAPDFSATLVSGDKINLTDMLKEQSVCLVTLRFLGCPLTRLRLAELEKEI